MPYCDGALDVGWRCRTLLHKPRAAGARAPIIPQHDECDLRPPISPRYETFETVSKGLMATGVWSPQRPLTLNRDSGLA